MTHRSTSRGRAHHGRGLGRRRHTAAGVVLAVLLATVTACSSAKPAPQDLGRVPIPSAPAAPIVPTASAGHAQLVAMGDAVHLDLGTQQGQITATGPDLALPAPAPGAAPATESKGVITVVLKAQAGSDVLSADALTVTDEVGHTVPVTADVASASAGPGRDAVVHLAGTFAAGHSTLTWSNAGKPLATWDFEVELD
ncbi:hypothetical protein P3T36_000828 [Kitasatospora sp. MAP12-15]|uniref:hypothetical protein n=1 Tax=unclassified Kitasatospora TaxID=2633591 RepID=UPI0024746D8A|nr:hypothetical protein [Kitasatospora sp. MAP12-44]MDH6114427.1 hypothetical protein [Kitasatospora sp. MAP12-44]